MFCYSYQYLSNFDEILRWEVIKLVCMTDGIAVNVDHRDPCRVNYFDSERHFTFISTECIQFRFDFSAVLFRGVNRATLG